MAALVAALSPAHAAGTASGTSISNSATLAYSIGDVVQTTIVATSASFLVGNKINLTVAETGGSLTSVAPGAAGVITTFTVTNNGTGDSCTGTLTGDNNENSLALTEATVPASSTCTYKVNVTSSTSAVYSNSTGSITTSNAGTTAAVSATLAVGVTFPSITVLKSVQTFSDPANLESNPKAIPGAVMLYTVTVTNTEGAADTNTVVITDPIPANTEFFANDLGVSGSGPVLFADGAPESGLSYTFTSLANITDNISFSDNNGASYDYTPLPINGYDSNVTHIGYL